jgi:site-specific recombinase XerC
VKRGEVSSSAPRALSKRAQIRYLRAVQSCSSARDRALALVPFYAGTRIAETVALDVEDVRLSARKGVLRVLGKGQRMREIPIHPQLRVALSEWLGRRRSWAGGERQPGAVSQPAWRPLSARAAHEVITRDRHAGWSG